MAEGTLNGVRHRLASDELPVVFVNYRRANSKPWASAIHLCLGRSLDGLAFVFRDTDAINLSEDWKVRIMDHLAKSSVLVVVMAEGWHKAQDDESGRRRIDDENDWVRIEIATALRRGVPVFPVLLEDAELPKREWLPEDIRGLCDVSAHQVREDQLEHDLQPLTDAIVGIVGRAPTSREPSPEDSSSRELPPSKTNIYGSRRRRSMAFVGRNDTIELLEGLLVNPDTEARISASIEGLAGVGKTELALQLVERLAQNGAFAGGIYWLDAEDPDLTLQWGDAIADQRGVIGDDVPSTQRAGMIIRQLERSSSRVLVVLDNVTEWTPQRGPFPLPTGVHVQVLITTRLKYVGGSAFEHIHVGMLDPDAARSLLENVADRESLQADRLLVHLEGHALGIELAGAYLRRYRQQSPDDFLRLLMAGGSGVRVAKAAASVPYQKTVDAALLTVWNTLDERTQHAWLVAASFGDGPATNDLADAAGLDEDARASLEEWHLLRPESGGRWSMHSLVRAFGRHSGSAAARRGAEEQFLEACANEAEPMDFRLGFQRYQRDQPHFDRAVHMNDSGANQRRRSRLLSRIARAVSSLGDFGRAKALLEEALDSDRRWISSDDPGVERRRNDLGRVLRSLGDLSGARALLEDVLAFALDTYPADHPKVADIRNNLGASLLLLGELDRARVLFEQALASNLKVYAPDHPEVARSRDYLGRTLYQMNDLEGARTLHEKALTSDLKTYGPGHPEVAVRRNNLAWVKKDLGDLEGAKALLRQALDSDVTTYGPEHLNVALGLSNLAVVLVELGEVNEARSLHENALDVAIKSCGADHIEVATIRFKLATLLVKVDELESAEELLRQALTVFRRRNHWRTQSAERSHDDILRELREAKFARAALTGPPYIDPSATPN